MIRRRRVLSLVLSVLLMASTFASAKPAASMDAQRAFEIVHEVNFRNQPKAFQVLRELGLPSKEIGGALGKLAATRPAEMSAHVGQALLFMLTVTGLDLLRAELVKKPEAKGDQASLLKMAGVAATQLLNNGSIYLSLIGSGATEMGLRYPVEALSAWMVDPRTRPLLFESLRTSIMATGTMLGWEAGSQLWTESTFLLESPQDYQRIQSLFGTGAGALRALFYSGNERDANDLRLMSQMARNMFYIALFDQDLRSHWIDNTLRTRIFTGDFAVFSAALASAGIGTMLLPGGGTVAGFILGVAAITVAINIPEWVKDSITSGWHTPRQRLQHGRMITMETEMRELLRRSRLSWRSVEDQVKDFRALNERRHKMRSSYLTVSLERVRLIFKQLFRTTSKPITPAQARERLRATFSDLDQFFQSEMQAMSQLIAYVPEDKATPFMEVIAEERARVMNLAGFFHQLGLELDAIFESPSTGPLNFETLPPRAQEFVKFIEVSYARGFDENRIN